MSRGPVAAVSVAFSILLIGCAGGPRPAAESVSYAAPTGLILESTLSGTIQGLPLKSPGAIAVGQRGSVYLLDEGNRRVIWFNRDLTSLRDFGGRGDLAQAFNDPRSVALDADQNVWISDFGHKRLVRTSERLELTGEMMYYNDSTNSALGRPGSMAVTDFGDMWVVDLTNQRLSVLDQLGELSQTVGDFGSPGGKLEYPAKIVVDPEDHVWVCDRGNRRLVVYDDDGGLVREIKDPILEDPTAVAFGPDLSIWVLEETPGKVTVFEPGGRLLASFGPIISGTEKTLSRPADLAFLPDGRLLISDRGHDRVLVCRPDYASTDQSR